MRLSPSGWNDGFRPTAKVLSTRRRSTSTACDKTACSFAAVLNRGIGFITAGDRPDDWSPSRLGTTCPPCKIDAQAGLKPRDSF